MTLLLLVEWVSEFNISEFKRVEIYFEVCGCAFHGKNQIVN